MAYIDKDKLNKAFTALRFNEDGTLRHWDDRPNWCMSGQEVEDLINSIPTADVVEVKHGCFIGTEFDGYADGYPVFYEWKCSECGCIFENEEPTYNYCPQCGAKMDGKETEDVGKSDTDDYK